MIKRKFHSVVFIWHLRLLSHGADGQRSDPSEVVGSAPCAKGSRGSRHFACHASFLSVVMDTLLLMRFPELAFRLEAGYYIRH